MLFRSGIVAIVSKLEAAGMAQHVRVDGERQFCGLAEALDEMMEAHGALTNT